MNTTWVGEIEQGRALDVLIVGEHPTRHRGFATVGREVARSLQASGIAVRFVARDPPPPGAPAEPYEVLEVDRADDPAAEAEKRLAGVLGAVVAACEPGSRVPLLSIGGLRSHAELLAALAQSGLRERVAVIAYLPVDLTPLPPRVKSVLEAVDLVVPYTSFGADAVRRAGARVRVAAPIPHGVDTSIFKPLGANERAAVRRERFDVGDDVLLVGYFGYNSGHKRPDLALRIFAAWVRGGIASCAHCQAAVERPLDPAGGAYGDLERCPRCDTEGAVESRPTHFAARLYLHTQLLTRRERRITGGWDLELMARRLGVHDRVLFEPSLQTDRGVNPDELARRMATCDVHLLPYEAGAWELTVLETAACGVPNVVTAAAAPPEYAAPFSTLVPTSMRVQGPLGVRAFIDVGRAVEALERLAGDPAQRELLGRRGIEVARAHQWHRVGAAWHRLLRTGSPR